MECVCARMCLCVVFGAELGLAQGLVSGFLTELYQQMLCRITAFATAKQISNILTVLDGSLVENIW